MVEKGISLVSMLERSKLLSRLQKALGMLLSYSHGIWDLYRCDS